MAIIITLVSNGTKEGKPYRFVEIKSLNKKNAIKKSEFLINLKKSIKNYNELIEQKFSERKNIKFERYCFLLEYHKKNFFKISKKIKKLWYNLYLDKELTKVLLKKEYKKLPKENPKKLYYLIDANNGSKEYPYSNIIFTVIEVNLNQGIELIKMQKKLENLNDVFYDELNELKIIKKRIFLKKLPKNYSLFDSIKELKKKYD